jgi:hypothetical protein
VPRARRADTPAATCTDLLLPPGTKLLGMRTVTSVRPGRDGDLCRRTQYLKVQATEAFGSSLGKRFRKASWPDVQAVMTSNEAACVEFWIPAALSGAACYLCTCPADHDAAWPKTTYVAHDPNSGVAYLVSVQGWGSPPR